MSAERQGGAEPVHGAIVLDKPAGVSSAKALTPRKRELPRKTKIGHAGTLDPFATGVLLALVGDATRLSDLAMELPKTYRATVRFGVETSTLDPEGDVVARADPGSAPPAAWPLERFLGEIEQVPPAFSALKVGGRRAYELARAGRAPDLPARRVRVDRIEVVADADVAWPGVVFEVACGRGTYIRSLARDLGAAVGLPASLAALRRTAIGPFTADQDGTCHPPIALVRAAGVPEVALDREAARAVAQGRVVPAGDRTGTVALVWEGRLLGLGRVRDGRLHAHVVLSGTRRSVDGDDAP